MSYREKCLSFHDEACIICGYRTDIQVHHVDGDTSNKSLLNLIPVCRSCHRDIHNGEEPIWSGKLVEKDPLTMQPVKSDSGWTLTIENPFSYRKVVAGSRGRVTLGPEYEGEAIGIAVTPLKEA